MSQRRFWRHLLRANTTVFYAPTVEALREHSTEAPCSNDPPSRETRALNTNEFARMVAVLLEIEEERAELVASDTNLSLAELDRRENRDVFSSRVV